MKILAVDFSSEDRGIAVVEQKDGAEPRILGAVCERGGRRAIELVDQTLQKAGCQREEIDCLAIGLGPGSYTGIRGSISLAQGWQLGRDVKLIGISSVECIATQAREAKILGTVHIVIDAQREEFYLATYEISENTLRETVLLHLEPMTQIHDLCKSGQQVVGPDLTELLPEAKTMCPDAKMLGRLAVKRTNFIPGEKMEPIYLRETNYKKAPPRRIIS